MEISLVPHSLGGTPLSGVTDFTASFKPDLLRTYEQMLHNHTSRHEQVTYLENVVNRLMKKHSQERSPMKLWYCHSVYVMHRDIFGDFKSKVPLIRPLLLPSAQYFCVVVEIWVICSAVCMV